MPTIHHRYGGSNANIWLNCAAAPGLIAKVPRRPAGAAAEHGTFDLRCVRECEWAGGGWVAGGMGAA